ncbi:hypothetical protein CAPTEDRAFT_202729 [Capitella teleta]|uniref:Nucleotide-diphospho-sugar transferase domain-containing protein n=1 Tax=Capitella teleta TaxID=283909 RepID=R7UW89_CAPTE|nr:hypothetical protein CAPTEDRAFT_202729 [Capitella teleta]|eukprot:ELU10537.1 hypothetical protein CAPTEDRAFT_202729 [Capitella teleta]
MARVRQIVAIVLLFFNAVVWLKLGITSQKQCVEIDAVQEDHLEAQGSSMLKASSTKKKESRPASTKPATTPSQAGTYKDHFSTYASSLEYISQNNAVFLIYVDLAVRRTAINFHMTSLERHGISNYLFVTSSNTLCVEFWGKSIPCHVYVEEKNSNKLSSYGSKDFIKKMNIRTYMILETLRSGYDILHTDADMYYYGNPLPRVKQICNKKCSLAALIDWKTLNAGFVYVRSTNESIKVYEIMKHIADTTGKNDQVALNTAVNQRSKSGLHYEKLPKSEFKCGKFFYELERRNFGGENPCKTCLVVHNNFIVGMAAKEYRAKEMFQWEFNEDKYFSVEGHKFLSYMNSETDASWTSDKQRLRIAFAIGQVFNRTVILPKFHCPNNRPCSLLYHMSIMKLDQHFGTKYKVSTFLRNPLLVDAVKSMTSIEVSFVSNTTKTAPGKLEFNIGANGSPDSKTIFEWLGNRDEDILVFKDLKNGFSKFVDSAENDSFNQKCKEGLVDSVYQQTQS